MPGPRGRAQTRPELSPRRRPGSTLALNQPSSHGNLPLPIAVAFFMSFVVSGPQFPSHLVTASTAHECLDLILDPDSGGELPSSSHFSGHIAPLAKPSWPSGPRPPSAASLRTSAAWPEPTSQLLLPRAPSPGDGAAHLQASGLCSGGAHSCPLSPGFSVSSKPALSPSPGCPGGDTDKSTWIAVTVHSPVSPITRERVGGLGFGGWYLSYQL